MQPNIGEFQSNPGGSNNRPSKIELLEAARIALEAEAEAEEIDNDAFCEEHSAIYDALSFERPKTGREIEIMLRALDHHTDMLLNGVMEEESPTARQERGAKVERILSAVRTAFQA